MLVDEKTGRNGKIGSFATLTAIFFCFLLAMTALPYRGRDV
jgi:hypothetical protein